MEVQWRCLQIMEPWVHFWKGSRKFGCLVCMCFIDLETAYKCVPWDNFVGTAARAWDPGLIILAVWIQSKRSVLFLLLEVALVQWGVGLSQICRIWLMLFVVFMGRISRCISWKGGLVWEPQAHLLMVYRWFIYVWIFKTCMTFSMHWSSKQNAKKPEWVHLMPRLK